MRNQYKIVHIKDDENSSPYHQLERQVEANKVGIEQHVVQSEVKDPSQNVVIISESGLLLCCCHGQEFKYLFLFTGKILSFPFPFIRFICFRY